MTKDFVIGRVGYSGETDDVLQMSFQGDNKKGEGNWCYMEARMILFKERKGSQATQRKPVQIGKKKGNALPLRTPWRNQHSWDIYSFIKFVSASPRLGLEACTTMPSFVADRECHIGDGTQVFVFARHLDHWAISIAPAKI